ncbi:hypothetical protein Selin_1458 [Desulfurispirillum indicum S5]|uniref:TraK protein n=1 Tax=Desulfurispirillum indicum (strain ATCC BAA-1389 / DSM 22839 / S5) TaxID=653733 RepID=E6W6U9_DESIS|nr:type-F conjugative transfer system secretin TraK [Desulfurispirillum indicum]ADU66192.1 hypothetical protein Selin_1458 [Desulfurispirillum indicum S5]
MKRTIATLFTLLCLPLYSAATIKPDIPTPIELSNLEPNRILCPIGDHVSQIVFADDKPLTVQYQNTQAFLQFKHAVVSDETGNEVERLHYSESTDLYAICGDDVYHLVASPKAIRGQTIRLGDPGLQNIRNTLADFRQLDIVDRAQHIVERAYTENLPTSWQVWNERKEPLDQFDQITAHHRRTIEAPGTGLQLREYVIISKQSGVELTERDFIHPPFTHHPFFISLVDHRLQKGEQTRLFVVERVR